MSRAVRFTVVVLFLTTFFVGAFMYLMGWKPFHALYIGVMSAGTTTVMIGTLLPRLSVPEEIKQVLILESIINDITVTTVAVVIVQIIQLEPLNIGELTSALVGSVFIAIIAGIVFTILWVNILWKHYKGEELTYIFTLGVLFLLFPSVELIGGNGAIAVLVLSLSLGNLSTILETILGEDSPLKKKFLRRYTAILKGLSERFKKVVDDIKKTHVDFSFFIRNFFFVYLGIIFDLGKANLALVGICLMILLLVFVGRYLSSRILGLSEPMFKQHSAIMAVVVARGFTAIFAALLPSTKNIMIPQLEEIILIMVLLSTLATIIGSIIHERRQRHTERKT